ncbi:hypothetical protein C2L64_26150 [Paraburkholderia hospita]|uniref:Uncharacterized protein n=1 Tax=Paraburkholderia hospita TaxID=169430 RepID=A0AAN1JDA8_9BURK|nr:hypothetical protein C2L64_26150 [Paraburkholderia hospita]
MVWAHLLLSEESRVEVEELAPLFASLDVFRRIAHGWRSHYGAASPRPFAASGATRSRSGFFMRYADSRSTMFDLCLISRR